MTVQTSSIPATPRPATVLAAFDVDGTLTRHDSLLAFLDELVGPMAVRARLLTTLATTRPATDPGIWRQRLKCQLLGRLLAGVPEHRAEHAGWVAAHRIMGSGLRPDTSARLRWHRACGHHIILVSAAPALYLRQLGQLLHVQSVLATELEVDPAGRLTGGVRGRFCQGEEKVRRLSEHLGGHRDGMQIWAYGDSEQDRALLDWADTPFWTRGVTVGTLGRPWTTGGARS